MSCLGLKEDGALRCTNETSHLSGSDGLHINIMKGVDLQSNVVGSFSSKDVAGLLSSDRTKTVLWIVAVHNCSQGVWPPRHHSKLAFVHLIRQIQVWIALPGS